MLLTLVMYRDLSEVIASSAVRISDNVAWLNPDGRGGRVGLRNIGVLVVPEVA